MNVEFDGMVKYLDALREFKESRISLSRENLKISTNSSDKNILKLVSISKDIQPIVEPKAHKLDKKLSDLSSSILKLSEAVDEDMVSLNELIDKSQIKNDLFELNLSTLRISLEYKIKILDSYMKDKDRIASKAQDLNEALTRYASDVSNAYKEIAKSKTIEHNDIIRDIAGLVRKKNNARIFFFKAILDDNTINTPPLSITDIIEYKKIGSQKAIEKNDILAGPIAAGVISGIIVLLVAIIANKIGIGETIFGSYTKYKESIEDINYEVDNLLNIGGSDLLVAYEMYRSINALSEASKKIHDEYLGVVNILLRDTLDVGILVSNMNKIPKGDKISDEYKKSIKEFKETGKRNIKFLQQIGQNANSKQEEKK
ncbi:hypothetical protein QPK13_13350 [Photorhabdus tasmaniensis]